MSLEQLDERRIAGFWRDGFVVIEDLLAPEELERFAPEVDLGVEKRRFGDTRELGRKTRYEQSFLQCMNLWEDCPGVRPLTFHPALAECAAGLLGVEGVRVWHDQALYKEPSGRETDPHQDHPYWPIAEDRNITAWIPLDGSTLENGAMGYVPRSHRFGVHRFVNIFGNDPPYDLLRGPEAQGVEPVFVEVPKGSVAFHHGRTIHVAKPNRSSAPRRVHTVIYFADGSTRAREGKHFALDRAGIEVGAPIRSDVTPIAWPRPVGTLPDPPADSQAFFLRMEEGYRRRRARFAASQGTRARSEKADS